MEDQEQPFAAFVLEALAHQSTELGQWWAERAELAVADSGEPNSDGNTTEARDGADRLIRTLLTAAADSAYRHKSLVQTGMTMGAEAHRRNRSLHLMLKEVDLLGALVLQAAEGVATEYSANATGHEGLAVAQRIADATSQLRLAAATGYTHAIEDELRQRYRAIRHNLRNPLGTIKTAVALLTDENVPVETRVSPRVRAMVVRNTRSLDQMIGEALGDAAARLRAFDTSPDTPADLPADSSTEWAISGPKQRDNVARSRQRPNLESGAF
jgi:K+-sensing histidine kinase KdpD